MPPPDEKMAAEKQKLLHNYLDNLQVQNNDKTAVRLNVNGEEVKEDKDVICFIDDDTRYTSHPTDVSKNFALPISPINENTESAKREIIKYKFECDDGLSDTDLKAKLSPTKDLKEEKAAKMSYFQIFRFATCEELTATLFGIMAGILSGCGVCFNLVQFGELTTSFVERTSGREQLSSRKVVLSAFGGGRRLQNASYEENMDALVEDGLAMLYATILSVSLSILLCMTSVFLTNWSALRQITRIRQRFLEAVLRQDMEWYDTDTEFNLATKLSDNMLKIKDGIGDKLAIIANLFGTSVVCLCQAFPLGWELTLACCSVVPFSIVASVILSNYQSRSSVQELKSYSMAGKQAEEVLKSVRTVVAFGGENIEVERYKAFLAPAESYGRKRGLYTGLGTGFNWVLTYSLNAIGLMYGSRLVLNDWLVPTDERSYHVGNIFTIFSSVYTATQCITFCIPHAETFSAARAAAVSIFDIFNKVPTIDSLSKKGMSPRRIVGEISIDNVHFSYPARPDVKVLKGFSLKINPGESVALVGSSGCGKSTILQLIQRLYDPHQGTVKLDGKDIKTINVSWLRSSLGVVGQEPVLFRGTIFDNIAIGSPEATLEEVQSVAQIAYAHDFISKLPNGYDTKIGERGASLSGGQKQRIAIARSLLREPAVLLLDEATSALDPQSERKVQAALDRASVGRTTLIVSHRLSTIENVDRIICMEQGVIIEEGTHQDLMNKKGAYYKLVTTGKEGANKDVSESLPEENEDGIKVSSIHADQALSNSRQTPDRRPSRKFSKQHGIRRDSQDWMTPRGSIWSLTSASLQNYTCNAENPEEKESEEEVKPASSWQLLKLNAPEWVYILTGSIAACIQGACFPAFSVVFGFAAGIFAYSDYDSIRSQADMYSGLFLFIAAVAGLSMCMQSATFTSAGLKMTTRLRHQYFNSLLKQEMGFFDKESNTVGALCARLSGDAAEVQGATGLRIGIILQGISSVFIGFLIAIVCNWKLTLVGTVLMPVMVASIWLEGVVSQKSAANERAAMESAAAIATEAVVSIRTVQSLGVERAFLERFSQTLEESCAAVTKKNRWRGLVLGLGNYIPFMSFCSATVYGTYLIATEGLEYKTVLMVNQAVMYGAFMLAQSLVFAPSFNSAKLSGARIIAQISRVPRITTSAKAKNTKNWIASGEFNLKQLEFSYPTRPHQRILKGIDLKVEQGKTVALVGSSGCGKSTVLQLMQRFYDPDSGTIELDEHDIRAALTLPCLRQQLGVVQQEPVLFNRTIGENIAYGDNARKVTMQEISAAAKSANIHDFIVSLPKGYDTNLGSGGAQLSGGQKQRICIARALIRSPKLLLLDEATSALDANSERTVSEALDKAAEGRTCITIAHRLTTIKDADIICVLDKGNIVEKGTHAELLNQKGLYWKMSRGQHVA